MDCAASHLTNNRFCLLCQMFSWAGPPVSHDTHFESYLKAEFESWSSRPYISLTRPKNHASYHLSIDENTKQNISSWYFLLIMLLHTYILNSSIAALLVYIISPPPPPQEFTTNTTGYSYISSEVFDLSIHTKTTSNHLA